MFNPDTSAQSKFYMQAIEAAAPSLGVQVIATPVRSAGDIEVALESFARLPNGGLMLTTDSFTGLHYPLIADLARRFRLPSIGQTRNFAKDGGLMFYGNENDLIGQWRQAAGYVDRILKGAKPGDLPVQEADRYAFILNLKTAKALNLEIPPGVLALADAVIE
jgi:putative tryptophan/tyrosine transport system substrate-binding protein